MDFNIKTGQPEKQRTSCLVLPIFEPGKLDELTIVFDNHAKGVIKQLVKLGDISGKLGTSTCIPTPCKGIDRVLLIGCGKKSEFNEKTFREVIKNMMNALQGMKPSDVCCFLTMLHIKDRDISWKIKQATKIAADSCYCFVEFKSTKAGRLKSVKTMTWFAANKREVDKGADALEIGVSIASAMKTTKDLANTPANICTPAYLAKAGQSLAKEFKKVSCAVLEQKDLKALKMGAFLAVAQGSVNPPKLVTLEYRGTTKSQAPYVFVGKGITFDTGGNSLKPADRMIGMKYDMCGAATVLGLIRFAAMVNLPLNIIGVLAAAENMPGGQASRPDDIVTTMSGQTVEILNTDAEGRLVLADALTYCERYKPKVVIDMATLTGACVVALGYHHSGLLSNHQKLADELLKAGIISGDKCWQLPLSDEYTSQLDSNFADFSNIGGPDAGTITAACFLSKFTKKFNWAHLDIAGTACRFTGKAKGATGNPIPMLADYLLAQIK